MRYVLTQSFFCMLAYYCLVVGLCVEVTLPNMLVMAAAAISFQVPHFIEYMANPH